MVSNASSPDLRGEHMRITVNVSSQQESERILFSFYFLRRIAQPRSLQMIAALLTDAQLNSWASNSFQVMAGYTASNRSTDMQLDASKYMAPQATFIQSAQQLRAGSSAMQILVTTAAASAIEHQCSVLAYALPNDWNVTYY